MRFGLYGSKGRSGPLKGPLRGLNKYLLPQSRSESFIKVCTGVIEDSLKGSLRGVKKEAFVAIYIEKCRFFSLNMQYCKTNFRVDHRIKINAL